MNRTFNAAAALILPWSLSARYPPGHLLLPRRAIAEQGVDAAQFSLGFMYAIGVVVCLKLFGRRAGLR